VAMSLWLLIVLFTLIKLPIAAMMLVLPFRDDAAMGAPGSSGSSDDDGGSRTPPGQPHDPHPRWPMSDRPRGPAHGRMITGPAPKGRRRGQHGTPAPRPPRRVRSPLKRRRAVPAAR